MIDEDALRRLPPDQLLAAFNEQCEQAASVVESAREQLRQAEALEQEWRRRRDVVAAAYDNLVPGGSSCGGRLPPSGLGAGER